MMTIKHNVWIQYIVGVFCGLLLVAGCASQEESATIQSSWSEEASEPSVAIVSNVFTENLVGKIRITIDADSALTYTAFKLTDPLRLVLDLPNVDTSRISELRFANGSPIVRITPFQFSEGDTINSRIEVALSGLTPYQVFNDANRLFVDLETPDQEGMILSQGPSAFPSGFQDLTPSNGSAMPVMSPQLQSPSGFPAVQPGAQMIEIVPPPQTVGEVSTLSQVLASSSMVTINDIDVTEMEDKTRITVYASQTPNFDVKRIQTPPRLTVDLEQSDLPPGTEKVITPDSMGTLVKQIRLFQLRRTPGGADNVARILIDLRKSTKHQVSTEPGKLIVDIQHPTLRLTETTPLEGSDIVEVPLTTGIEEALMSGDVVEEAESAAAPTIRAPKTGEEKEYKGQLVSIHFQNADILDVLDVIAEVSGLNLVVHPGVGGSVTVRLDNIPWDQALDIVLKLNNLAVEIEGNILRIAPATVFNEEVAARVEQQRQQIEAIRVQEELDPLETKLINVNFAAPGDIVGLINEYFQGSSAGTNRQDTDRRGTITVDERTKTLIIQDTADNIKKIEEIVATLDRRTPQVMIEARVVSIQTGFRKELGIDWGGRFTADATHGNPLNYRFPYSLDIQEFGVNLPGVGDPVTSLPISLGSIDNVISIFARIDAAEEDNFAKTLSQPKIFTQDNVPAAVSSTQTQYLPTGGDSQTPASLQPVSAVLSLNVTPRISRDGFITMEVTVSNGAFPANTGSGRETSTQTVNSRVTVRDGETIVIGGIYATTERKNFTAVPYLHKIPLIGRLFKSTLPNSQIKDELLVFLTPRILDRSILKPESEGENISFSY